MPEPNSDKRKGAAKDGSRRGGARPNSGPKPKVVKVAVSHLHAAVDLSKCEDIETIVLAKLTEVAPKCIDNLVKLADGIIVKDVNLDGTVDYFETPPDRQANEYLLNRLLGKPTERKEVTGESGQPIAVAVQLVIDKVWGGEGDR